MHINTVGRFVSYWGIFDNHKASIYPQNSLVSYFVSEYLSLTVNVACGCAAAVAVPCEHGHGYDVITAISDMTNYSYNQ